MLRLEKNASPEIFSSNVFCVVCCVILVGCISLSYAECRLTSYTYFYVYLYSLLLDHTYLTFVVLENEVVITHIRIGHYFFSYT